MPAATATFSDSAPWASGIATRCAAIALSCGRIPAPSLPTMTAMGPCGSRVPNARGSGIPSDAAAHRVTACFLDQAMKPLSSSDTTGWRNVAPMAARSALELRDERRAARRARQVGSDQRSFERDAGGERLLHEADALDQGEATSAARLAALEITYRRLQITGDESPRAFPAAAEHSICEEALHGRYVKIALTIAGSDSGGGAGIQADLKTFHQFGVFGTSVITAVTAQNTVGVRGWEPVPAELVTRQLDALADDLPPSAVKSGMLGSARLVGAVADGIARRRLPNYVLDPVMVATSGDRLLDRDAERLIVRRLVPLTALVTPNLDEAAVLVGGSVRTPDDMERAGRALVQLGARAALVKGGHLAGEEVVDVLVADGAARRFARPRLETTSTHGTGCTLSAAVVAGLALGRPLERAVEDALDFVHRAIAAAPGLGQGHGPLNHFVPAPPRPPTNGL